MVQNYDLECQYCGKTFSVAVESEIMDEYVSRLNQVPQYLSDGVTRRPYRPVVAILKNVDEQTKFKLENFICDECLAKC